MNKKRRHKRKRKANKPTRPENKHSQRSDAPDRQAAEASRAPKSRGSSRRTTGRRNVVKLPLLVVLIVGASAVVLYGVRFYQVPRDSSEQQEALVSTKSEPSLQDERVPTEGRASWKNMDDPAKDGWDTEVFANNAMKQLKAFGKLLAHPVDTDAAAVEDLITNDFACGPLRPAKLIAVHDDQDLKVDRSSTSPAGLTPVEQPPEEAELPYRGADGLVEALRAAVDSFSEATDVRFKFKIFRVFPAPGEISTRQYFSISGHTKSGTVEQHATWDIGWRPGSGGALPRMRWIRMEEFEQAECCQPEGTLFADCTESVLGGNASYAEQFLRGANHWFERIQDRSPFGLFANPGLAVGDVNGDGLDDLYVCQEAGLPNRLFIQNPDGSASEQSAAWGVDWLESSRSALLVDLDNDSDQDLVVAILGGVVVAENDGQGQFHLRDVLSSSDDTMSLSAVDYDMDGRLDIYVCAYHENQGADAGDIAAMPGASAGFVVHDANNGGNNILFHNQISSDGTWRFTDVTSEVGLDENNHRWSFAAAWDDYDNDGDQDLYVANDYGRDHFYRNDLIGSSPTKAVPGAERQFVDLSDAAQIEDSATGMSITWGDYDRDGWMDVLVSNMWSSAGQRVTYQSQFKPDVPLEIKRRYQRQARGNTLLKNRGDGTFDDLSAPAGIEMGRWAWGSHFVDLNNDGWEDLFVSNGYITTEDTGDL